MTLQVIMDAFNNALREADREEATGFTDKGSLETWLTEDVGSFESYVYDEDGVLTLEWNYHGIGAEGSAGVIVITSVEHATNFFVILLTEYDELISDIYIDKADREWEATKDSLMGEI